MSVITYRGLPNQAEDGGILSDYGICSLSYPLPLMIKHYNIVIGLISHGLSQGLDLFGQPYGRPTMNGGKILTLGIGSIISCHK